MKLLHNQQHLIDMLSADHLPREDKSAIRFALNVIHLVSVGFYHNEVKTVVKDEPQVPYWRYVEYADDGCTIYQCLDCKEKWEARTPPGWMEYHDRVEGPDPDGNIGVPVEATGAQYHFVEKDEPVYHPVFKFCPYCGIEWDGPIRRDDDNEFMWGDKRLTRRNKQTEVRKQFTPDWWMVIQSREIWKKRDNPEKWVDVRKFSPYRHSPQVVMDEVAELRDSDNLRSANDTLNFGLTHEYKAITRNQKDMKELYPIIWQELDERR